MNIVNQRKYCIPGETVEITANNKDLKSAGVVTHSQYIPVQLAYLARVENKWVLENDSGLS